MSRHSSLETQSESSQSLNRVVRYGNFQDAAVTPKASTMLLARNARRDIESAAMGENQ